MPRAPRIPRAQVLALSRPDPALLPSGEWVTAAIGLALLFAALFAS